MSWTYTIDEVGPGDVRGIVSETLTGWWATILDDSGYQENYITVTGNPPVPRP